MELACQGCGPEDIQRSFPTYNTLQFNDWLDLSQLINPLKKKKAFFFSRNAECRPKSQRSLDQFGKRCFSCRRQHEGKSRIPVQEAGEQNDKMRVCTGMKKKAVREGTRADMLVHILWCMYLLGACFKKKSVPKENNEVFMFSLTGALMLFQSTRAASFLRKTSAVPSGYFCFCSERENGKWGKEKMKCLWQENNVPEATPLNTEKQGGQNSIHSPTFWAFLPIWYFTFNLFLFPLEMCSTVRNHRTVEIRDARSLLDHVLHRPLPAENCSPWHIFLCFVQPCCKNPEWPGFHQVPQQLFYSWIHLKRFSC